MVAFTEQSIPLGLKQLQNFTSVLLVVLLQCTVPHRIRLHCFTQVPLVTYLGIRSARNMVKFRNCIQNLWKKGLKYPIRESWRFRGILNSVQTALILQFLISEFLPWSSSLRKLELNYPPSHISVFILFYRSCLQLHQKDGQYSDLSGLTTHVIVRTAVAFVKVVNEKNMNPVSHKLLNCYCLLKANCLHTPKSHLIPSTAF